MKTYLSIGTNTGRREENIARAVEMLESVLGTPCTARSTTVESKAWGFDGADFLDCVVCFDVIISPRALLRVCKDIEWQMGRRETLEYDESGRRIYHDRIIDIDILLYGDERINEPDLIIPHPLMHERDFIMGPLREILEG